MTALLEARGVCIAGRLEATDVDLPAGTLTALIGPNGGGKTSVLRALATIDPSEGEVLVEGEPLRAAAPARRARMIAFLPASRELPWPIEARDLIELGPTSPSPGIVRDLIAAFELQPIAGRPVNQLSTGERARVLLARAFASQAKLLLLDEPLSNLDPYWVIRTLELLRGAASDGRAALVSVHDLAQLESFDRSLLVSEGRLVADSAPFGMIRSEAMSEAFRISRSNGGWEIRRQAGR